VAAQEPHPLQLQLRVFITQLAEQLDNQLDGFGRLARREHLQESLADSI
jgi:hypothetical protein